MLECFQWEPNKNNWICQFVTMKFWSVMMARDRQFFKMSFLKHFHMKLCHIYDGAPDISSHFCFSDHVLVWAGSCGLTFYCFLMFVIPSFVTFSSLFCVCLGHLWGHLRPCGADSCIVGNRVLPEVTLLLCQHHCWYQVGKNRDIVIMDPTTLTPQISFISHQMTTNSLFFFFAMNVF